MVGMSRVRLNVSASKCSTEPKVIFQIQAFRADLAVQSQFFEFMVNLGLVLPAAWPSRERSPQVFAAVSVKIAQEFSKADHITYMGTFGFIRFDQHDGGVHLGPGPKDRGRQLPDQLNTRQTLHQNR